MRVKRKANEKFGWCMQQAVTLYCDMHEELHPGSEKGLALFPPNIQKGLFFLMWHHQILKWIRKKHEVKEALNADLLKVINSEMSFGELHKKLDSNEKLESSKIFTLAEVTKFEKSFKALEKHPLGIIYKKIEKNTEKNTYKEYFPSRGKSPKKSKNSIHLDDLVTLKGKADDLKERLQKKTKKLALQAQKKRKPQAKNFIRMPSIQDLVVEKDKVMGILKNVSGNKFMSMSQQAIFKSSVMQKVQEQNLLDHFEFRADKKFLVTAILTVIDHFISKPREFTILNSTEYK